MRFRLDRPPMTNTPDSPSSDPTGRDAAAAAAETEWFGSWWADRPNQFVALLSMAKLAALAMDGDPRARQTILDGRVEAMLGVDGKYAVGISESALNIFLSAAGGALDPSGEPNPDTFAADALNWAARWERANYSR